MVGSTCYTDIYFEFGYLKTKEAWQAHLWGSNYQQPAACALDVHRLTPSSLRVPNTLAKSSPLQRKCLWRADESFHLLYIQHLLSFFFTIWLQLWIPAYTYIPEGDWIPILSRTWYLLLISEEAECVQKSYFQNFVAWACKGCSEKYGSQDTVKTDWPNLMQSSPRTRP